MPLPANAEALRKAGYVFLDHGECEVCGRSITWWLNPWKRRVAIEFAPGSPATGPGGGGGVPEEGDNSLALAHWMMCGATKQKESEKVKE